MFTSQKGMSLIKGFEGLRLQSYQDSGQVWTVGYGHTKDVKPGQTISEEDADRFFLEDLWYVEQGVRDLVKVSLTQNQFDALVSFSYNVGLDIDEDQIPEGLGDSTLLRKLNRSDYAGAVLEFPKWNKVRGKEVRGLTRRRQAERELFLS